MANKNGFKIYSFINGLPSLVKPLAYLLVIFLLVRFVPNFVSKILEILGLKKTTFQKDVERRNKIEKVLSDTGLSNSLDYDRIHSDVLELSYALGTDPDLWFFQTFTEDEETAILVVSRYVRGTFKFLSEDYQGYTGRRSLQADLIKSLSSSQYASIKRIVE